MMQYSKVNPGEKIIVTVDAEIEDIIPIFFEKLGEEIDEALESLEQGNYENIEMWGHTLKGVGMGYGFDAVSQIGQSLEQAAKIEDQQEIQKLVDHLSAYLESVEVVYE